MSQAHSLQEAEDNSNKHQQYFLVNAAHIAQRYNLLLPKETDFLHQKTHKRHFIL